MRWRRRRVSPLVCSVRLRSEGASALDRPWVRLPRPEARGSGVPKAQVALLIRRRSSFRSGWWRAIRRRRVWEVAIRGRSRAE